MKVCCKCKKEFSLNYYHKDKSKKDGHRNDCKECQNQYRKYYYSNNKKKIIEKQKIKGFNNKQNKNIDFYNQASNEIRICSRCKIQMKSKNFHKDRREKDGYKDFCKKCAKKDSNTLEKRFNSYNRSAKYRNINFNLTKNEFQTFWNKSCFYCNSIINGIGIDRIDSSKGYILENCVSCCFICNTMKNNLSQTEFKNQIIKLMKNYVEKN